MGFRRHLSRHSTSLLSAGVLALSLLLGGCALNGALERGHAHVQQGHYRLALAAYQRAVDIDPSSEEARRLRNQLAPYAVKEASAEARAEMARGRYEHAHKLAEYTRALDPAAGDKLHKENSALMHTGAEGLSRKGLHEPSYALAARMRSLYPRHPAVAGLLERARGHFFAESEQRAGAGDFDGALAAVAVVERYEPALRPEVDKRRHQLKGRWADTVARQADEHHAAGKRGPAAALYARAYAIGRKPAHLERMRAHVRDLREEGRFVLGVQPDDKARSKAVADRLSHKARAIEGVTLPTAGDEGVSMIATLSGATSSCREDTSLEQGAQEYVSGHREVPNADYDRLSRDVSQLRSQVDTLEQRLISARQQADTARDDADRCERDKIGPLERRLAKASAAADAARAEHERLRARAQRLQARLDSLPRDRQRQRERLQRRLEEVRRKMRAARAEAKRLEQKEQRIRSRRDAAAAQCAVKLTRAANTRDKAQRIGSERDQQAERLGRVESELAATPSHDTVPVMDTFRYPVRYVERTCNVRAELNLQPAWTSAETRKLKGSQASGDRTHAGYPRYGVIADPLSFDHSEPELIDLAGDVAADDAVAAISERVKAYYAHMTDNALDMAHKDPHAATDLMLAMLLAAPSQLTGDHKRSLSRHLQHHYQLSDWRTLTK